MSLSKEEKISRTPKFPLLKKLAEYELYQSEDKLCSFSPSVLEHKRKSGRARKFDLHPVTRFHDFFEKNSDDEADGLIQARFVVTPTFSLRLAKEQAGPPHLTMSYNNSEEATEGEMRKVLSAGLIYYNPESRCITEINGNSGGYFQENLGTNKFGSIIWALAILRFCDVPFDSEIVLHDLYESGQREDIPLAELDSLLQKHDIHKLKTQLIQSNTKDTDVISIQTKKLDKRRRSADGAEISPTQQKSSDECPAALPTQQSGSDKYQAVLSIETPRELPPTFKAGLSRFFTAPKQEEREEAFDLSVLVPPGF